MVALNSLVEYFETQWPASHADEWDRVGLVTGSLHQSISKVLVAVDLTDMVIDEAIELGAELVLVHHPVLLKGVNYLGEETLKGSLVSKLIRNNLACFAAHTNADVQGDGASSEMAKAFNLVNLRPLVETANGFGHGVLGDLETPQTLQEFAQIVIRALPKTVRGIAVAGNADAPVATVAICSGAGDSFISSALASEADVYLTSDLRHHPTLDALSTPRKKNARLNLIDVSHFAAESLWVRMAVAKLSSHSGITAVQSQVITDPWTFEGKH